jgi:hypothetical protein
MLIKELTLRRIISGEIRVVYRKWKRPTAREGGTLMMSLGQFTIDAVTRLDLTSLSTVDARAAGFESLELLVAALKAKEDGEVYRVELHYVGVDPRISLRDNVPDRVELNQGCEKLRPSEGGSRTPWRLATLQVIRARLETRAGDLAEVLGFDKPAFKSNVRKLKALGLTESLKVGYRLSARGEAVLAALVWGRGRHGLGEFAPRNVAMFETVLSLVRDADLLGVE